MGKAGTILDAGRRNPQGIRFADACKLAAAMGYELRRVKGSHHLFTATGLPLLNLQRQKDGMAKDYQVRQIIDIVDRYRLSVE